MCSTSRIQWTTPRRLSIARTTGPVDAVMVSSTEKYGDGAQFVGGLGQVRVDSALNPLQRLGRVKCLFEENPVLHPPNVEFVLGGHADSPLVRTMSANRRSIWRRRGDTRGRKKSGGSWMPSSHARGARRLRIGDFKVCPRLSQRIRRIGSCCRRSGRGRCCPDRARNSTTTSGPRMFCSHGRSPPAPPGERSTTTRHGC